MQPVVTEEVEAAEELLKPHPKDVPPQLLLAVEKDGRSLARGYEAATALSQGILQSLRDHRDSYKVEGAGKLCDHLFAAVAWNHDCQLSFLVQKNSSFSASPFDSNRCAVSLRRQ